MLKGGVPSFIDSYQTNELTLCDDIIARFEELNSSTEPSIHGHVMSGAVTNGGPKNRKDKAFDFLSLQEPLIRPMHEVLKSYVDIYCEQYTGFGMKSSMSRHMKVQKTEPKGGFHLWHSEHAHGDQAAYRSLVWTFYLNDTPEGEGETEFLEYGVKVQPKKGLLCLFPAGWTHTHRGNPVYSCDKYIATGWYHYTEGV